jgi:hypothetical protein
MNRQSRPDIDRDYILEKIGEEAIFEKYLGFSVNYDLMFCNPLRLDNKPACAFYYNGYKIKFHDITKKFNEDCFGIVMAKYNISFGQAIRKIAEDFGLLEGGKEYTFEKIIIPKPPKEEVIIHFEPRNWTQRDQDHWGELYVGSEELQFFDTFSVKSLFTHAKGRDNLYMYKQDDLCFAYKEGKYTKIYRPELPPHQGKFYNNIPKRLYHGFRQLPEKCDKIVLTKSMKDIIVNYVLGYPSTGPISENSIITLNGFKLLQAKTPYIYALFDPDDTGRECAWQHWEQYKIPYFFNEIKGKDISGLVKLTDYQTGKQFLDYHTDRLKKIHYDRSR